MVVLSGLVVGLPAAVVARTIMRLAALAVAATPQLTVATLFEILDVLGGSIVASLIYAAISSHMPWRRNPINGLLFGALLAALLLIGSPNGFDNELRLGLRVAGSLDLVVFLLFFVLLCLSFGVAMVSTFARVDRSVGLLARRPVPIAGCVLMMLLAGLSLLFFLATLTGPMP